MILLVGCASVLFTYFVVDSHWCVINGIVQQNLRYCGDCYVLVIRCKYHVGSHIVKLIDRACSHPFNLVIGVSFVSTSLFNYLFFFRLVC
jgi:hypothetical protein